MALHPHMVGVCNEAPQRNICPSRSHPDSGLQQGSENPCRASIDLLVTVLWLPVVALLARVVALLARVLIIALGAGGGGCC